MVNKRCAIGLNRIDCLGNRSGILTDHEIRQYELINPTQMSEKSLKSASYDLRLGDRHYLFSPDEDKWIPIFIGEEEEFKVANKQFPRFERRNNLVIQPFGAALIQLKETVDTITCVKKHAIFITGRFDLKLKIVSKGLVSQQATQVEPHSKSKLFCIVYNLGGSQVELNYNDPISTIEFHYLSCLTSCNLELRDELIKKIKLEHSSGKYNKPEGNNEQKTFCFDNGISDVRFFERNKGIGMGLPENGGISDLSRRIDSIEKEYDPKHTADHISQELKEEFQKKLDGMRNSFRTNITITIGIAGLIIGLLYNMLISAREDIEKQISDIDKQYCTIMEEREKVFEERVSSITKQYQQQVDNYEQLIGRKSSKIDTIHK